MEWRFDHAAVAMFAVGAVMPLIAGYVWPRRAAGGLSLIAMLASLAWWSVAYGLELSVADIAGKELFGGLKYVGICLLVPSWVAFVLTYIGRDRYLTRRTLAALMVEPVVVLTVLAIPATRDLVRFYPPGSEAVQYPVVGAGWVFWVHLVYTNVLLLGATALFVVALARVSRTYWREAYTLIAATLLPWVVNLLYNLDVAGLGRVDLTPIAFAVTAVVIGWGVFGRRLLGLSAIGRTLLVETMSDGMVVVDVFGRVVDLNQAAESILYRSGRSLLGQPLGQALPEYADQFADGVDWRGSSLRVSIQTESGARDFEMTRSALTDLRGRRTGDLVLLRDITARLRQEAELHRLLAERSRVARVLQDSLLPAALPDVPGLDLAARYRPGGDGTEVGGDFYDVFPLDHGRWAVLLGDVSGTGAEAAAMTALTRYTVRAVASEPHTPRQMLRRLNREMLRQSTDERYATAVYMIVEPHVGGAKVTLALGGHLLPMVRRGCGRVERVGRPGLVLGVLPNTELHDVELELGLDDVLCLYTDGVTEARSGQELFGEERLEQLLAPSSKLSAGGIADRIERLVGDFSDDSPQDDIAMVVLQPTGDTCCSVPGGATCAPLARRRRTGVPEPRGGVPQVG
ncbi:MAG: histidine kinase N-terminal 7TM domain-containing protein [Nocardioidaceae bacterium]